MEVVPPYLNKMESKYEKEYNDAQKKELKAKKDYEYAQEYTKLCKEQLDHVKQQNQS